ncbi:MAG TPA: cell division protein FtsA [Thermomicrobiales bacterium]|nr:cell division protein FtsA [Thermomicrobiales bacterium]
MPDQFIVGVDVGSSKLCSAVAVRERSGAVRYVGHGSAPSGGLRGGEVIDPEALSAAFRRAVEEARYLIGTPVEDIVVSISGAHIEPIDRMGGLDLTTDRPVSVEDIVQAISQSRGTDPAGLHTVHRVVRGMALDSEPVSDPTGRYGRRLDVWTRDYAVPSQLIDRLRQSAEAAGVRIHTLIPEGVAAASSALSPTERDAGVALIDIGSATTDIAVYAGGDLQHIAGFALGGHHVTADIAAMLEIPLDEAEDLKRAHGAIGEDNREELYEWTPRAIAQLQRLASFGEVPPAAVRTIAAARAVQIIDRAREALVASDTLQLLQSGAVLTGGGSMLTGIGDIASAILGVPVRCGGVLAGDGFPGIADPTVSASVGLTRYCATRAAMPPPTRRETRSYSMGAGASAFVHPLVMQTAFGFGGSERDTTTRRDRGAARRAFTSWLREFVPARMEE